MPYIPLRTCVACEIKHSKSELLRIGKTKEGDVVVGYLEGRGTYLCPSSECIERAIRKRLIAHPLRLGNCSVDWKRLESQLLTALAELSERREDKNIHNTKYKTAGKQKG